MVKALVAALAFTSAAALAQSVAPASPTAETPVVAPAAPNASPTSMDADAIRREVDQRVEAAKKELREEMRAQVAAQSASQGWQEEWNEEKRKLELFVPNGYLRVRPDLFNKFDLGRGLDSSGYSIFPHTGKERTQAGVNMRFRFDPTLNISEDVRIHTQVDLLDNVIFGSTPDYAASITGRNTSAIFSESQTPPVSGLNDIASSIAVKRVYGEVNTPVGVLRFGRMGSQWGLGMLHNDGNCADCDFGETVDRFQFVAEPLPGYFVIPMIDFNAEGLLSGRRTVEQGQPFDVSNTDDTHSYVLALARKDTDAQAKQLLDSGRTVFNYGIHFTYRLQGYDSRVANGNTLPVAGDAGNVRIDRRGSLFMPDVWVKLEKKKFRVELEAAAIYGKVQGATDAQDVRAGTATITVVQFGATLQSEVKLIEGALRVGMELGFASGDKAPGLGNYPGRKNTRPGVGTSAGDIDGPQYACNAGVCIDPSVRNFRFSRDYRVDMILWREILGGITDAFYVKPNARYRVADGLDLFAGIIYSRTIYQASAPSGLDNNLGVEFNLGARYETEDGFFAQVQWGLLVPLAGMRDPNNITNAPDVAQAVRGMIGIKF